MDNNLPLLMLILAGLLVISLIIYSVRYKNRNKRHWSKRSLQLQEPRLQNVAAERSSSDIAPVTHQQADSLGLNEIIGEVKIRYCEEPAASKPATFKKNSISKTSELFVLHVMALPNQAFIGYELLQSLLSSGLRFGEMNIFHRYEQPTGQGKILFSLASATEPGTFNLDAIGSLACAGLSLFMDASKVADPVKAFNLMLDTARLLAEDLGGKVVDEGYQELTPDTINNYQQRVTV